jgi:D-3-phosphoglycerate dehydrogenase / 2-oxoglutarate reductase
MQFQIQLINQIAAVGLDRLPAERYVTAKMADAPDAILVRSADMHALNIPASVKAIGRAGAGTNNIPVKQMSERGVPVFNAPGANANAVKELVLTGMLMAVRNVPGAMSFVRGLDPSLGDADMDKAIEEGKKNFAGRELAGATLGVIGLGKIGCLVADAAIRLGMEVRGYDPEITVDAAWSLPAQVKKAASVAEILRTCDIVSLHVPLVDATRHLINAKNLEQAERCTVILNFAREAVIEEAAVLAALDSKKLKTYVCDFPTPRLHRHARVIALPHLGASTSEAEDNCAVMVVDQIRDYLENGNITNSVNFPDVHLPRESGFRLAIANANVPNMVGQISTALAAAGINIHNMLNKSKGNVAYTVVDADSAVPEAVVASIAAIPGVLAVRYLPLP